MNDFNAKFIKISAKYLEEKLLCVKIKKRDSSTSKNEKKNSSIKKFVSSLFKS